MLRAEPPIVRDEALARVYVVVGESRRAARVIRREPDGRELELARSRGRLRVDWRALAEALLADALSGPVQRGLAGDFARFLAISARGARTLSGTELRDWLATWQPFPSFLRTGGETPRRTGS